VKADGDITYNTICSLPNYYIVEAFVPKVTIQHSENYYGQYDGEYSVDEALFYHSTFPYDSVISPYFFSNVEDLLLIRSKTKATPSIMTIVVFVAMTKRLMVVVGNMTAITATTRNTMRLSIESRTVSGQGQVCASRLMNFLALDHGVWMISRIRNQ
jgi:hypothetical protein